MCTQATEHVRIADDAGPRRWDAGFNQTVTTQGTARSGGYQGIDSDNRVTKQHVFDCLLYTSDAADE